MANQFNYLRGRATALLLILLVPFLILNLIAIDQQRAAAIDRARADALALTRTIASENNSRIESTHLLMTALAHLPAVQSREPEACTDFFIDLIRQYPLFNGIYVVDTATNLGFCSSQRPIAHTDNSPFEWYQRLLATRDFVTSNYRIGAVTGKPGITLAQPVFDAQGKLVAAVGIGLSLDWFGHLLQNIQLPKDSLVIVLDGQGNMLAHNQPPDRFPLGKPYEDAHVRQMALGSDGGSFEAASADGTPYLYHYTALGPDTGNLRVVIGFSQPVLFAAAEDAQRRTILAFAALSLVALAVAWVSSGLLTRPIRQLTDTVYQVADGKLSGLSQGQTQIIELKALLNAFDRLVSRIHTNNRQQLEALESVNSQLRGEVEERTRAQQRARFLQELSADLSEAISTEQVALTVLGHCLVYLGAASGSFDLVSGQALTRIAVYPRAAEDSLPASQLHPPSSPLWSVIADQHQRWLSSPEALQEQFPTLKLEGIQTCILVPVVARRQTVGVIGCWFTRPVERTDTLVYLLQTVSYQCAQVLERVRLGEEAQELAKLQERQRLARDLHDTMSQTLYASTILAQAIPLQMDRNPPKGRKLAQDLLALNRAVMGEMRSLLLELRPEMIAKTELAALFQQLIDVAEGRTKLNGKLELIGTAVPLPPHVHEGFYRVGQECINNILKHSGATTFWISLCYQDESIRLSIRDNGQGFDVQAQSTGFGLNNLRERADGIQGSLAVQSAPGDGTEITLTWKRPTSG
jgi:signal transduction histidine kinase